MPTPCTRCSGNGVIRHFAHVRNGVCFRCEGSGFEKAKPVVRKAPVARRYNEAAYLCEERAAIIAESMAYSAMMDEYADRFAAREGSVRG